MKRSILKSALLIVFLAMLGHCQVKAQDLTGDNLFLNGSGGNTFADITSNVFELGFFTPDGQMARMDDNGFNSFRPIVANNTHLSIFDSMLVTDWHLRTSEDGGLSVFDNQNSLAVFHFETNGVLRLNMDDEPAAGETEFSRFAVQNFENRIDFRHSEENSFSIPLRFASGNKTNVLVHPNGLGIGTFSSATSSPSSALHVFTDGTRGDNSTITSQVGGSAVTRSRTMLNLVNNGAPSMTFTDTSNNSTWFFSNTNDELNLRKGGAGVNPGFVIGADGQFRFVRDAVAEAPRLVIDNDGNLLIPGQVITVSDRNKKENIELVDTLAVLEKVAAMPISTWNYIDDRKKVSHVGPMAQDFNAAFELGNDITIGEMDKSGITMAAVQGLNQKVETKVQVIESLKNETEALNQKVDSLTEERNSQQALINKQFEMLEKMQARMEQLEAAVSAQQN